MSLQLPIERILASDTTTPPAAWAQVIGRSREGRPIHAYRFGEGAARISLIAGCHADEPVGPAMLKLLTVYFLTLENRGAPAPELRRASWFVVPHTNPDGAERNDPWIRVTQPVEDSQGQVDRGYDFLAYLRHTIRELPGDDVEFGFPRHPRDEGARPENQAVAEFLRPHGPFRLHASLHGMGLARGPWFLLEEAWKERTGEMRDALRRRVRELGYEVFDIDRKGEKGFWRIDEGFTTRPDSRAMAAFFEARGDAGTAALFRPSSMEFVRSLGDDPLTLVSEMPLFLLPSVLSRPASLPADVPAPTDRDKRRELTTWLRARAQQGEEETVHSVLEELGIRPMPIRDQMRLQLAFLNEALTAVGA